MFVNRMVNVIQELEDTYVDTPTLINKLSKMTWNVKFVTLCCKNSIVDIDLFSLFFPFLFLISSN